MGVWGRGRRHSLGSGWVRVWGAQESKPEIQLDPFQADLGTCDMLALKRDSEIRWCECPKGFCPPGVCGQTGA